MFQSAAYSHKPPEVDEVLFTAGLIVEACKVLEHPLKRMKTKFSYVSENTFYFNYFFKGDAGIDSIKASLEIKIACKFQASNLFYCDPEASILSKGII